MKKRLILLLLPPTLCALLCFLPEITARCIPSANVVKLFSLTENRSIFCQGETMAEEKQEIYLSSGVYPKEVFVEIGQNVCKGDPLCCSDPALSAAITRGKLMASSAEGISDGDLGELTALAGSDRLPEDLFLSRTTTKVIDTLPETIASPIGGVITQLNLEKGVFSSPGEPIATVSSPICNKVTAFLLQEDVDDIPIGTKAVISGEGLEGKIYEGVVTAVYPSAETKIDGLTAQTVIRALIHLPDSDETIKPGYQVSVELFPHQKYSSRILPYETICQDENNNEYVLTVKNATVNRTDIRTGQEFFEGVEVLDGLSADDLVILEPSAFRSGQIVRSVEE